MKPTKNIAILTSGGDASGMNACIRAVVRTAQANHINVFGIYNGYEGLIDGNFELLESKHIEHIIHLGGTILKTSRSERFLTIEGRADAFEQLKLRNINTVIVIGGDGSFKGAAKMHSETNINFIGIPGTIDNDIFGTDYTIGYDTAVNNAMQAIDKIRDTANSHKRLFFVEVMGRDSGAIAIDTGIAVGAEDIFIPETITHLDEVSLKIKNNPNKSSYIIVVSEGDDAGHVKEISEHFQQLHPIYDTKFVVLGHLLRGGNPTAIDRLIASKMGISAVEHIIKNSLNIMIGWKQNEIDSIPLIQAVKVRKEISRDLLQILKLLSY